MIYTTTDGSGNEHNREKPLPLNEAARKQQTFLQKLLHQRWTRLEYVSMNLVICS